LFLIPKVCSRRLQPAKLDAAPTTGEVWGRVGMSRNLRLDAEIKLLRAKRKEK
jgi:hypothetical protein